MDRMEALHEWFFHNRRDFPWRSHPTPYRVWISEVMLQQTRASVVVSYFNRWMELFPNVQALATAPLDEVIKAWEGLGYYSRARNLHAAAQQIVLQFEGKIPETRAELSQLKGLGPYTIGAILSFGFHQRAAAIDGNAMRVLSRYFSIEESLDKAKTRQLIAQKGEEILDEKTPWITAEALIELGASLCAPRPHCEECPLRTECRGFQNGKAPYLPNKKEPDPIASLFRVVPVVVSKEKVLLKRPMLPKSSTIWRTPIGR